VNSRRYRLGRVEEERVGKKCVGGTQEDTVAVFLPKRGICRSSRQRARALLYIMKLTYLKQNRWRRIQRDFLHFHKPRVHLLCWILMQNVLPHYVRKLEGMLHPIPRYCELPSWRKVCDECSNKHGRSVSICRSQIRTIQPMCKTYHD
jgi:hypothetical protein